MRALILAIATCANLAYAQPQPAAAQTGTRTFLNPVLPSGPDPWVTYRDGFYYYMNTTGNNLTIWKTRSIADLKTAEKKVVWTPPTTGPYSHELWAPELHFLRGRWYIFFSADAGTNVSHRVWVVENPSPDPMKGQFTLKGKLSDPSDRWAIDGTVFEEKGRMYFVWSGWEGAVNGVQSLYIAELQNPWTVKGKRVLLSMPQYPWEKIGDRSMKRDPEENPGANTEEPLHIDVNEGPEILQHGGKVFLIYSASACWTDFYELGMLTASAESDLLDPSSWKKRSMPVFWQSPAGGVYAPGHNSFFQSPDGKEDWILYHANPKPNQGCGANRAPHAQPFRWTSDGTPDFGRPIPAGTPVQRPSGERIE